MSLIVSKFQAYPNHKLILKVGAPVMLLRNIDQQQGLCNAQGYKLRDLVNVLLKLK